MTADSLDVRIAHLEGAYEQIDKRLGSLDGQIQGLRAEVHGFRAEIVAGVSSLRTDLGTEVNGLRTELRSEVGGLWSEMHTLRTDLVTRMDRQFFWILGLLLASIASRFVGR